MTDEAMKALLHDLSEKFHKVLSSMSSVKIIGKTGHRLPTVMFESINANILSDAEVEKICADGFQACVYALNDLGDPSVTIHNCNPTEEPEDER